MKQKMTLLGVKRFKGEIEGNQIDFCKLRFLIPVSANSENERGYGVSEFVYGDSSNFSKFEKFSFPQDVEVSFDMVIRSNKTTHEVTSITAVAK